MVVIRGHGRLVWVVCSCPTKKNDGKLKTKRRQRNDERKTRACCREFVVVPL